MTPYAVLKYCGEKLLMEGPTLWSKMETGRLPMKNLPALCDWHLRILEEYEVLRIRYSGGVLRSSLDVNCVWSSSLA